MSRGVEQSALFIQCRGNGAGKTLGSTSPAVATAKDPKTPPRNSNWECYIGSATTSRPGWCIRWQTMASEISSR